VRRGELLVDKHRCELNPNQSGLAQWSEADGPSTILTGSGIPVPLWDRGALTPRTPRDVPACSTHAGYHSPPPRQQHA
jgi:hypothetical protein